MIKRNVVTVLVILFVGVLFTGCKKELTKEEVEATPFYNDLLKQNDQLKEENSDLNDKITAANEKSPEEVEIEALLDKISRDSLIKMEVAITNNPSSSIFIENKGVLSIANKLAMNSDWVTRYTVDEIELTYGTAYTYVLYDEDNSVFEVSVYEGDFIVFKDLPDKVFYSYGAKAFGDAYLARKNYYPNTGLLTTMMESALITKDQKAYGKTVVAKVVEYFDEMEKESIKTAKFIDEGVVNYTFHNHGSTTEMKINESQIQISHKDKKYSYKASKESIKSLKKLFSNK